MRPNFNNPTTEDGLAKVRQEQEAPSGFVPLQVDLV